MPKCGIFNASLLHNEHGQPQSSNMINIQWTKIEQKSIVTFITEEFNSQPEGKNFYGS